MKVLGLVVAFGLLSLVFGAIERRPQGRARSWRDVSVRTDVVYWFFTPLVTRTVTTIVVAVALLAMARALGLQVRLPDLQTVMTARGPVSRQPRRAQAIEVLLLSDLLGYWSHRLFHGRRLWPFHAVHHGSEHVDWLSSVRLHPVNEALTRLVQLLPLLALGFDPRVLAATVPVFTLYALLLHANVTWSFGPLKYVVASPAFHRWHHAADVEARDKNFAGLFPLWDLCFGTFHVPPHPPERFGVPDRPVPEGVLAQMLFPFRT